MDEQPYMAISPGRLVRSGPTAVRYIVCARNGGLVER